VPTCEDADLSSYDKRMVRPDFERMLSDIDAGMGCPEKIH
jgi:hypothetical protein